MSYPKYKFYATVGFLTRLLQPLDQDKLKYSEQPEGKNIFMRRKLTGKIVLYNDVKNNIDDYSWILGMEQSSSQCQEIKLKVYKICPDGDFLWYEGYFTASHGYFDLDNCKFEVLPSSDDKYRCLIEKGEDEVNILDAETVVETAAPVDSNWEFFTGRGSSAGLALTDYTAGLPAPSTSWKPLSSGATTDDFYYTGFRERIDTPCVVGVATPPPGTGWILLTDDCAGTNTSTWVRQPQTTFPFPNSDVVPGYCNAGTPEEPPQIISRTITLGSVDLSPADIIGREHICQDEVGCVYSVRGSANSTYSWYLPSAFMVINLTGTTTRQISFDCNNIAGNFFMRCDETTDCGDVIQHTFATSGVEIHDDPLGTSPMPLPVPNYLVIEGPTNLCSTQTGIVFRVPEEFRSQNSGKVWSVFAGASIVSGQGTWEIVVDLNGTLATGTHVICGISINDTRACINIGSFNAQHSAFVSIRPITEPIVGATNVCETSIQVYSVPARTGSTFNWSVAGGTITGGSGTNEIEVTWGGTTGDFDITVKETMSCGCNWLLVEPCGPADEPPIYWCNAETTVTIPNGRLLMEALEYILAELDCPGISGVIASDFFEWNPLGDAPGYVAGENYVTLTTNQLNHLIIQQKSDVKNPVATNPATTAMTTWFEMTEALRIMFKVYWDIDASGNIRLEHEKYFATTMGLDTTLTRYDSYVKRMNRYQHLTSEMPKFEKFFWMESLNTDFVGLPIIYPYLCVNQDPKTNSVEYSVSRVTTDINFILTYADQIANEGFVITANTKVGTVYSVIVANGLLTSDPIANAPLSWANLHFLYHRYGRVLPEGLMNNISTAFFTFNPTVQQEPLYIPFCCGDVWDARKLVKTELGDVYLGQLGKVISAEHEPTGQMIKLILGYSYANL